MEKLRLRVGEYELEVEGEQAFIEKHLAAFDQRITGALGGKDQLAQSIQKKTPQRVESRVLSPAEFYKQKRPDGGTKTLVVLGTYLRDQRSQANFRRADINSLCEEVRIKHVHPQYYTLAVKQGLLMGTENGFSITLTGDELVERMGQMEERRAVGAAN
jgi:hypothetical protein